MSISSSAQVLGAARAQQILTRLFAVLPHQQRVLVPFKTDAGGRDAVHVLHHRVDVNVVRIAALRGRLNIEAHRSRIAALDLALELAAEAFESIRSSRGTRRSRRRDKPNSRE